MDNRHESELYNALVCSDKDALKMLLENGGDVNEFYFNPYTDDCISLLHLACEMGRLECVKELLKGEITLNVADRFGLTPLMYALANQEFQIAEILLQKDQDLVNDEDCSGMTPLDLAVHDGNVPAVHLLAQYGANVNHQTFDGVTPIMRGVSESVLKDPTPILMALIECGADVNVKDKKCKRAALQIATLKKNVKAAEVLILAGADMYTLDSGAKTPLTNMILQHVRMRDGEMFIHEDIWTIILMMQHAGIDYDRYDFEDGCPMLTAALLKAEPLIRFFLANGANPNKQTVLGMTSLLKSVSKKDMSSVRTLVEYNCWLDLKAQYYKRLEDMEFTVDAYDLAILLGHFDIAKFLIKVGHLDFQKPYLFDREPMPKALARAPDMIEWLQDQCLNPESLSQLAVFAVRRAVGINAVAKVKHLPIPPRLMRLIVLKDFFDIDVDF